MFKVFYNNSIIGLDINEGYSDNYSKAFYSNIALSNNNITLYISVLYL